MIRTAQNLDGSRFRAVPAVETTEFDPFQVRLTQPDIVTREAYTIQLPRNPSNPTTRMTSALTSRMDLFGDLRFNLMTAFGAYIAKIPSRLGVSPALDAASESLVAAHMYYCARSPQNNSRYLKASSHALRAVRHELNEPVKARSSEVLCAIMLLMTNQVSPRGRTLAVSYLSFPSGPDRSR